MKENRKEEDVNLSVHLAGLTLRTPVIAASGTFGFGREYGKYVDLNRIGGISVKGLTLHPRAGNPPPRIAETPGGVLNSVGLQNPGVHAFIRKEIPFLRQYDIRIIANVAGGTIEEYEEMAEILEEADIDAMELNVSCPNVKAGCAAFGSSAVILRDLVASVKRRFSKPLFVKLTPNVTSITEMARAAADGGADGLSLINTLLGMAIDIYRQRPVLANITGGLSGPAVKPVAVRMVYEVFRAVNLPIIGMGGIESGADAAEFMLAGASAVMVGTANFTNPAACVHVAEELRSYLKCMGINDVSALTGALQTEAN